MRPLWQVPGLRFDDAQVTVTQKPVSPGRVRDKPLTPSRREGRVAPVEPVVNEARVLFPFGREAMGAASARLSLRPPRFGGSCSRKDSGSSGAARMWDCVWNGLRLPASATSESTTTPNFCKNGCRDATIVAWSQQLGNIWLNAAAHHCARRFFATPLHEIFAERG